MLSNLANSYKLKCEACEKGSSKQRKLMNIAVNYLFASSPALFSSMTTDCIPHRYRYGTLIVFANYLIEMNKGGQEFTFPEWLHKHREITKLLKIRRLD